MRQKVKAFLRQQQIGPHSKLLAGFSGGPDSTCLLALLTEIASDLKFKLTAAYLDHGLRPAEERENELRHVKEISARFGLELWTKRIQEGELEKRAKEEGRSLEEIARAERYTFFNELKEKEGFSNLCLGHNLDDQLETILMRLFLGAGPEALKGMLAVNGWILRPLLFFSRNEIEDFLREHDLSYFTDMTNLKDEFLRNQIRHKVLPVLREVFPGLGQSLLTLSCKAFYLDNFLTGEAWRRMAWEKTAQGFSISIKDFLAAPAILRLKSLYQHFSLLKKAGSPTQFPFRSLIPLLEAQSGQDIHQLKVANIIIYCRGQRLFCERDIVSHEKIGYFIVSEPGIPFKIEDKRYLILAEPLEAENIICTFRVQESALPLVVRTWQAGDRIKLCYGTKKLKKLFSDWHVPKADKDRIMIIEDKQGIVAVIGQELGFKNVVRWGAWGDAAVGGSKMFALSSIQD